MKPAGTEIVGIPVFAPTSQNVVPAQVGVALVALVGIARASMPCSTKNASIAALPASCSAIERS